MTISFVVNQHKVFILQFWRVRILKCVSLGSSEAVRKAFLAEALGEVCALAFCDFLESARSLAQGPSLCSQAAIHQAEAQH